MAPLLSTDMLYLVILPIKKDSGIFSKKTAAIIKIEYHLPFLDIFKKNIGYAGKKKIAEP